MVCINLTSTESMSYIIYDLKRNLLAENTLKFKEKQGHYCQKLEELVKDVKEELSKLPTVTVGVGISVPSAYYEEEDLTNYDLIPEFKDFHIRRFFRERFELENIEIVHDVFSAAKSEYEAKPVRDHSLFYFYCGYGVGGCFILKGEAVSGQELLAGEVGKMLVEDPGQPGDFTTIEEIVSVPGILKKVQEQFPGLTFEETLCYYQEGDERVTKILDQVFGVITRMLYNLVWLYNPTKIVVDSCFKEYAELMEEKTREFLQRVRKEEIYVTTEVERAVYEEYHEMRGCFRTTLQKWINSLAQETSPENLGE